MTAINPTTKQIIAQLDHIDRIRLANVASHAQTLEFTWNSRFYQLLIQYEHRAIEAFMKGEPVPDFDFLNIIVAHAFNVTAISMMHAMDDIARQQQASRLAKKSIEAKSLRELQEEWDKWKRKEFIPKRQKALADNVKKQYLKKLQKVWDKHQGDVNPEKAADAIRRATGVSYSRAKMIVATETTRSQNRARRKIYDLVPSVTHYLFMAIRDHRTTKWCNTRHGIVYTKGTAILDEETPPIHWYCRSDILPLVANNPSHAKLINDLDLRRENRKPARLPKEWE